MRNKSYMVIVYHLFSYEKNITIGVFTLFSIIVARLYRLVSVNDVDIDFWEVLQDFAEKIFLLPTVPQGTTGIVSY